MTLLTGSGAYQGQGSSSKSFQGNDLLSKEKAKEILGNDFSSNFPENVQELVKKLYSKRDENGEPIETLSQTFRRVALGVAIARLKYTLKPFDIIQLPLEKAIENQAVLSAAARYYLAMCERKMFANTPANINASPDISLYVLQYESHGELLGWSTHKIWMFEHELRNKFEKLNEEEKQKIKKWVSELKGESSNNYNQQQKMFYPNMVEKNKHEMIMGYYASKLRRRGGLAACGVTYAGDSIEEIEKAACEIMDATKGSMGMGINTSSIRPWQTPNSDGSTASGPDRFVEKLFCPAGQSIAQGGRRGGAFIELRDSDHPDITLFLSKKQLPKEPFLPEIYEEIESNYPQINEEDYDEEEYKEAIKEREIAILKKALEILGKDSYVYYLKQEYLKNYNVSVRAARDFMQFVENREWYPAMFGSKAWSGNLYDFTKPVLDKDDIQMVNPLNKELLFKEYSIFIEEFPESELSASNKGYEVIKSEDGKSIQVKKDGIFCFYAPDIFKRICIGMANGGEPGIQFADLVEAGNANSHVYELNTCNPCGEQNLPAQIGKDGIEYRGICNLTTIHAAHRDFWDERGNYLWDNMEKVAELSTEFMDDVTTVTHFPIKAQNSTSRRERRNGGGFAGVAEFLSRHEVEFGTEEANNLVSELYNKFSNASLKASQKLAEQRGTYDIWQGSSYYKKGIKVRNSCMVNQQPTGTMAQLCGTSWGPEPFNGIVFSRKVRDSKIKFTAPGFEEAMKKRNAWPQTEEEVNNLCEKINQNGKRVSGLSEVPEDVQKIFKINTEIDPIDYIKHLASIQKGDANYPECFNALSNTCVIKRDMSWQDVWDSVILGYKLGIKSLTFYPDGTRLSQPVEEQEKRSQELEKLSKFIPSKELVFSDTEANLEEKEENLEPEEVEAEELENCVSSNQEEEELEQESVTKTVPRQRPKRLYGFNEEVMTPEGPVHVHVYFDEKGPRQVFAHLMRGGGVTSGMIEAICRMTTKALKWGCPPKDVAEGLINIQGGPKLIGVESGSIPDAIGRVLMQACKESPFTTSTGSKNSEITSLTEDAENENPEESDILDEVSSNEDAEKKNLMEG